MKFHVPEMNCGHCRMTITNAMGALDSTATIAFDMDARTIEVATSKPATEVITALDEVGFDAEAV